MAQPDFVLVVIMSEACGHCRTFKTTQLSSLKNRISKDFTNVGLEIIDLPSFSSPIPSKYPSSLQNIIKWFPMFILIDGENWNLSIKNKKNILSKFRIFNGTMNNGIPQYVPKYKLNVDDIFQWMENGY